MLTITEQFDYAELRKVQHKILEILIAMDRVCRSNGLKCFLAKGTLLGAVKYQGFIPWDDDCDVYMMREDFLKFEKIASKELGEKFFFQTTKTDPYRHSSIAKVRMNGTKIVTKEAAEVEKYHQGIFVDVFITDYYPGWAVKVGKVFNVIPDLRQKRKKYPKGSWQRNLFSAVLAPAYLIHTIFEKTYMKLVVPRFRCDKGCKFIAQEAKLFNGLCWETKNFTGTKTLIFEGHEFYVPDDYELMLQKQYGMNYRNEEPAEKDRVLRHARKIEIGE